MLLKELLRRIPKPKETKEDLSLKSKVELESECIESLEKVGFGNQDFIDFVVRMRILSAEVPNEDITFAYGEEKTQEPRVRNNEEKLNYIFMGLEKHGRYGIRVKPDFVKDDGKWQNREGVLGEEVFYTREPYARDPKMRSKTYAQKITHFNIRIPPELYNLTSFVDGSSFSVFQDGVYNNIKCVEMTDKEVQAFCGKVFDVYLGSKARNGQVAS